MRSSPVDPSIVRYGYMKTIYRKIGYSATGWSRDQPHAESVFTDEYAGLLLVLVATRRDAGVSQVELARRLGKPQPFISYIERGVRRVDLIEFYAITRAPGADPRNGVLAGHQRSSGTRADLVPGCHCATPFWIETVGERVYLKRGLRPSRWDRGIYLILPDVRLPALVIVT
jgi:hypothetical protein